MVEYCVYWLENGEPMHEVFSSLAAAVYEAHRGRNSPKGTNRREKP